MTLLEAKTHRKLVESRIHEATRQIDAQSKQAKRDAKAYRKQLKKQGWKV